MFVIHLPAVPQEEVEVWPQPYPRMGLVCYGAHRRRRDGHRVCGTEHQTGEHSSRCVTNGY